MRILKLRFSNLNSLAGEWTIDFSGREYETSGIFAIVGPTGAGKTTILDALCLALYGQTPRLGKITKSANELMTRQTSECFAEVVFESSKGRYRCHWSQKRARKNPNGALQQSEHEISDAFTGKVLESKIKEVSGKVEECTGMKFEQFTRSILLAQGDFSAFLGATAEERAPILEQITGTGIYSEISKKVYERYSLEKAGLDQIKEELGSIEVLPPEEYEQLKAECQKKKEEADGITLQRTDLDRAIAWQKRIGTLEGELTTLNADQARLALTEQENEGNLLLLKKARAAQAIEPHHRELEQKKQEQHMLAESIRNDTAAREECGKIIAELQEQAGRLELEIELRKADQSLSAELGTIREQVIAFTKISGKLDQYTQKQKAAEQDLARCRQIKSETESRSGLVSGDYQKAVDFAGQLRTRLAAVLKEKEPGFWYDKKAEVTAEIHRLESVRETILATASLRKELEELQFSASQFSADKEGLSSALEPVKTEISLTEKIISGLEEKQRDQARIRDLEEERSRLIEGKACPLCGSTSHPYVTNQIPDIDETEQELNDYRRRLSGLREKVSAIQNDIFRIDAEYSQTQKGIGKIQAQIEENEKIIASGTANLWIAADEEDRMRRIEGSLAKCRDECTGYDTVLNAAKDLQQKLTEAEETCDQKKQEMNRIHEELQDISLKNTEYQTAAESLAAEIASLSTDLQQCRTLLLENITPYGYATVDLQNPDAIILNLTKRRDAIEKIIRDKQELADRQRDQSARLASLAEQIGRQQMKMPHLESEIIHLKRDLKERILSAGFGSCDEFLKARIDRTRFEDLELLEKSLQAEQIRISALLKEKTREIEQLKNEKITDRSIESLEQELSGCRTRYEEIQAAIVDIRLKLRKHADEAQKQKDLLDTIHRRQAEFDRWAKLNKLIGSASGQNFQKFAQGITFDVLISHANRHLMRLNKRYLLKRTAGNQLDMSVVDMYQAGEIRSTKNLSGGESFMVSLALALGLSDMASNNVRVDSLFLDEGFGTLDNASLDTAIDALTSLQRGGKLVGIISHVSSLKERIPTQIVVEKKAGGVSILSGPGVRSES